MKAFSTGQRFRFPDDPKVYIFKGLYFKNGVCIIIYDDDEVIKERVGFGPKNMIHV